MNINSQKSFIENQLKEHGKISRNFCLQNYITRLGARANDLRKEGWLLEGKYIKTATGKDFIYEVKSMPYEKEEFIHPITNQPLVRWKKL